MKTPDLEIEVPTPAIKKGGIYARFGTSKPMEQQGIVLDFGDDGRIKIARAGGHNQQFAEVYNRRFRPHAKKQRQGNLSEEVATRTLAEVYAEAIIRDWEDIKDVHGNSIPYSFANCVGLMLDLPDLFLEIRNSAVEAAYFRTDEIEEAVGNS